MPRPILAIIDGAALAHNLKVAQQKAPRSKAWAVIKANAYGHGIERAVKAFSHAQGLAMLDLQEAVRCRQAGWKKPILLLEGFFEPRDLAVLRRYDLSTTVHSTEQLQMLSTASKRWTSKPLNVFLKMNSGMNRLGFAPHDYVAAWTHLSALSCVNEITHMTHFATADGALGVQWQLEVFNRVRGDLPGAVSTSNSAATLRHKQAHHDWIRPGIMLYGSSPDDRAAAHYELRPAMHLQSELIGIQQLKRGDTVGYGATFKAPRSMRIGIVACGYADGYPRHAGTGTPIVVDGIRTRTLGRVSMDMLAVDLTPTPDAGISSKVTLWGAQGLSVDEVAQAAGTIGYELLTAVTARVPVRDAA